MRNWHPLSKLFTVIGIIGLFLSWWSEKYEVQEQPTSRFQQFDNTASKLSTSSRHLKARQLPPLKSFQYIVDRPLFASTRRPTEREVVELDREPEPNFPASFVGSIDSPDGWRAFLSSEWGLRSAAVGDEVDGWTVMELEQRRVKLALGEKQIELKIFE